MIVSKVLSMSLDVIPQILPQDEQNRFKSITHAVI